MHFSDFSSSGGSKTSTWLNPETPPFQPMLKKTTKMDQKSTSYQDLVSGRCTIGDVMRDLQMDGLDSPFDNKSWNQQIGGLSGMGPSAVYLRQRSWPESRTADLPPPRPRSLHDPVWAPTDVATSTPLPQDALLQDDCSVPAPAHNLLVPRVTAQQSAALRSLPSHIVHSLLRGLLPPPLPQHCRFCKNNGERETWYRSHQLKDTAGRVACPVLRSYVCVRCGATGDTAHTIKYCPLSTNEERVRSAAMLRSVRIASGRRRHSLTPSSGEYVMFGETSADVLRDTHAAAALRASRDAPALHPLWAAVEHRLKYEDAVLLHTHTAS